ncbi:MAG: O-antigen ligase family protein, partial [Chloroflexi bacterium]|nr:O-antigen ligase family protein [Chloroflexota bacterium]
PFISVSPTLERISTVNTSDLSIKGRITSVSAGFQGYLEKPIFGWGPENYLIAWGRYFDADSGVRERFDQAHNKLVEELTTKGTVGIATYLTIWIVMFWVFVRAVNRRKHHEQAFVVLIGAALAAFFVQNMFLFDSPVTVLQLAVLVAFFIAEEMHQRQTQLEATASEGHTQAPKSSASRVGTRLSEMLQTPGVATVGAVIVAVILSLSIYFLNIKPFNAAAAVVQTANPSITWEQRLRFFEQSIDEFPALANYPRLLMLTQVTENLLSLTTGELEAAMTLIEEEAALGLIDEPENWRIYVGMARFYQIAAQMDVSLLEKSRIYVDGADLLAPRTIEVNAIRIEQERLEDLVAGQ